MKGLLGRLFGGGGKAAEATASAIEYNGFKIRPTPFRAEGQFQTAGVIEKDVGGATKEHRFIRAEKHASADDAAAFAVTKGKQIIDEQGDRLFEER
jgi:hypothetical protein